MRILLVCYDSPFNRSYGGALRTNSMWEALGRAGDVRALVMEPSDHTTLDSTPREGEIGRIQFKKPVVPWVTPEVRRIRQLVARAAGAAGFDVIVVRHIRLAMLVRGCFTTPVVADCDDLDKALPTIGRTFVRRQLDTLKAIAIRSVTRRALAGYAHVWFGNPMDMTKFPVVSGSVLHNVINAPFTVVPRERSQPPCVLMVGKFGYEPNAEGVDFFIASVLPGLRAAAPGVRFRLVGQSPAHLAARWRLVDGVEIAGFVDDLAAEYARASVVVAPIFSGGGTQIKVLEALAHECGTVVSGFSAVRFEPSLRAGEHMLVASDAHEWLAQCLKLMGSPAQAERLGRAGREVVLQEFSLNGMAREVSSTTTRICNSIR